MGVLGLWQLLQPSSRPLKLQGLEGKKLAIDISIWLYQATKGSRNRNGHIAVLYSRICKLLYFKIKPIFVFDGPNVPKLKERVLQNRRRRRNEAADKAKEYDDKIQKNILESYALQRVLGVDPNQTEAAVVQPSTSGSRKANFDDDLFILPEVSEFDKKLQDIEDDDEIVDVTNSDLKHSYLTLQNIDKDVFENLPLDIQFEILTDYKQALKSKKSQSYEEFPQKSEDFSIFQMKALLHKNEIASQINNLKTSMKITNSMETNFDNVYHQKVASEDHDEVILLTKKNSSSKLFSQKSQPDEKMQIDEELEDKEYIINDDSSKSNSKSPEYRIEFNEMNKIELVPKKVDEKLSQLKPTQSIKSDDIEIVFQSQIMPVKQSITPLKKNIENEIEILLQNEKSIKLPIEPDLIEIKETIISNRMILQKMDSIEILTQNDTSIPVKFSTEIKSNTEKVVFISNRESPDLIQIEEIKENSVDNKIEESDEESDDDFIEVTNVEKTTNISNSIPTINLINEVDSELSIQNNENAEIQPISRINDQNTIDYEEVIEYNAFLLNERNEYIREKQNNERLSNSIEPYVIEDAKHLLQLFGLPYLIAPGEAEAQCAFLDYTNVTEGSITEDSDVWLFGARHVYKNFFGADQFIDTYSNSLIESILGLDRESLINVALLVGSDYTEGLENVGIVKAVEILQEFEGQGIEKLKNFKEWHDKAQKNPNISYNKLRKLLSKLKLPNGFPSELVYNAYINPDVDKSTEEFTWSLPSLDLLRKFLITKMGWTNKKIDDDVLPVIKRINETNVQKTIDTFFAYETTSTFKKQSKRMKKAINSFKSKNDSIKSTNDDLNLSNEEDDNDVVVVPEQKKQPKQQKAVSSITITRINKTRSTQPKTSTHDGDDEVKSDLILIDKPTSASTTSTSSKRKSTESTSIKDKKVARKNNK